MAFLCLGLFYFSAWKLRLLPWETSSGLVEHSLWKCALKMRKKKHRRRKLRRASRPDLYRLYGCVIGSCPPTISSLKSFSDLLLAQEFLTFKRLGDSLLNRQSKITELITTLESYADMEQCADDSSDHKRITKNLSQLDM